MKSEIRNCQNCKKDFLIDQEDFNFYEKVKVPAPTFCPLCRAQRRFVYRNEHKLFKVKDAFTDKDIFSLFPKESGKSIVTQEEWLSDSWEALDYGMEYNFSRTFFEQLFELEKKVPVFNLDVQRMVNSPYSGNATGMKNSYLCFNSNYSEDCMYGNAIDYCKDCVDNSHINHSERCYESFWLQNCYQCYFTIISGESRNLYFCRSCWGCNDCFGCMGLQKSSYCIFNEKYSKEDYFKEIKNMKLDTIEGIKKAREKARVFWKTRPKRYSQGIKNLNSSGSYVTNSKNVNDSYLVKESENMRYCQYMLVPKNKECYDASIWGENMELHYETSISGENSYNVKFCVNCWPAARDMEYSLYVFSSSNCFGCVGLKKKQYCILNKQYGKDEYFKMVEKIKRHMNEMPYIDKEGLVYKYGEFFPIELSSYGYNNTIALEHFPISKDEAIKKGYQWIEVPRGEYKITKKIGEIPDSIDEVKDGIRKEVLGCENCKNAYRIQENEFIFLKKEKLPIPTLCSDCRHERRIKDRLGIKLYERQCMCGGETDETGIYKNTIKHIHGNRPCGERFKTGYSKEGGEIVYCEQCYQKEVY